MKKNPDSPVLKEELKFAKTGKAPERLKDIKEKEVALGAASLNDTGDVSERELSSIKEDIKSVKEAIKEAPNKKAEKILKEELKTLERELALNRKDKK